MKLPTFFPYTKSTSEDHEDIDDNPVSSGTSPWPWPYYCHRPRTLSFRTSIEDPGRVFRTVNTAYAVDDARDELESQTGGSGTDLLDQSDDEEESFVIEMAVRGLRSSERLFFEPGETRSIIEESKKDCRSNPIKESLVMSLESQDPYDDFRNSMEEMIRAYGLKEWEDLKDLLDWYLRVNGKANHGHILGAFVDILVEIQAQEATFCPSTSTAHGFTHGRDYESSPTPSSPLSLCTSSASYSTSSNSLSTPSASVLELEERRGGVSRGGGGTAPFLSCGVVKGFEIR